MTSLRSGVKLNSMKKLSLYVFLVLIFCNVGFAGEKREEINSKLGLKYNISSKLLYSPLSSNQDALIPKDDNDDTGFNILKNPLSKDTTFDSNNLKSWCDLIEQQHRQTLDGFSLEECRISNVPNQGSSIFWKSNIIKAEESRLMAYLNVYKKTQYSISMGCDIKNCNKWIPELEKIVSSFKVD